MSNRQQVPVAEEDLQAGKRKTIPFFLVGGGLPGVILLCETHSCASSRCLYFGFGGVRFLLSLDCAFRRLT